MSDFNPSAITALTLLGGKGLTVQYPRTAVLNVGDAKVTGLRFNTRVEGRTTLAFVPFTSITGVTGEVIGDPATAKGPTVALENVNAVFLDGGRLVPVVNPRAVVTPFGGPSIAYETGNANGDREAATAAVATVIAYLGNLQTADEKEDDTAERKDRDTVTFARTYGTDPDTYGAARAKQSVYDKAIGEAVLTCAACKRPIRAGHLPVYARTVGIIHRTLPCNPFSRDGIAIWNARGG